MPGRTRSRARVISGTGMWGTKPVFRNFYFFTEVMDDVIGDYGGNHPLALSRKTTTGSLIIKPGGTLVFPEPGMPSEWHNWNYPDWVVKPALSSFVNRVLATTGPLTPNVNLPLALFELKDVPRMLRHAGNLLHKIRQPSGLDPIREAAAANLAYKFGWAPIIQDLGKLLDFSEAARKQQKRIKGAYSSKGIRRRISLEDNQVANYGSKLLWSVYGLLLRVDYIGSVSYKTWATVRWTVRDPNMYGYEPSFNEALKTSLGFNAGQIPIQVWKAIPWTWMIDWFTDISNVLQANYNSIYFKPSRLSIMRYTIDQIEHKAIDGFDGNPMNRLTAGTLKAEFKSRYANNAPTANVTLRIPFMDTYKLSVLGSLAILSGKSGRSIGRATTN